jgi:hypothetical protein
MRVGDVLVVTPAARLKIWARRLDSMRRSLLDSLKLSEAIAATDGLEPNINNLPIDGERDKDYFSIRPADTRSAKGDFIDG